MHSTLFLLFEIFGFVSFAIILYRELKNHHLLRVFEIISCAVFGLLLEIGNTFMAHTYAYSPNFIVNIFNVPLAIGLGWATIIYCAMLLSDQYRIPWYLRPFMDALTALILDLAMDAVAIRLGFWHWVIPLNAEWYGVPFENLIGWILVVLSFSFLARFIRTLNIKRWTTRLIMLVSPLIAYVGLIAGLLVFSIITVFPYTLNNWKIWLTFNYRPDFAVLYNPQVQLWKLIVLVVVITELIHITVTAMIRYRKKYLSQFDIISFVALAGMHLFFFSAMFVAGIAQDLPFLVFLSSFLFVAHCLLHLLPYLITPKTIYMLNTAKEALDEQQERLEKLITKSLR